MHIAFITVGDTGRLTGGYLYHARVFAGLRAARIMLEQIVASSAALEDQLAQAATFGATFDPRRFDVLVVDALARAVCAPWLDSWRAERPLVAMVHELPSIAEARAELLELEAPLLRADLLITVSAHGRALLEQRGVPANRIRVVPPGRDRIQAPTTAAARKKQTTLVALCVAQWIPRKGILTLVQAWASRPRPGAVLDLVGETNAEQGYAAAVWAAIAQAPPSAPIVVRGTLDDATLADAYQAAALFVLPSSYEGYGMAYAEALTYGLPVIACDIAPVNELLGAAGWLVPPDDPAALSAALDSLISNQALRARLARAAAARARELPTWQDTMRGFQSALEEVITGNE